MKKLLYASLLGAAALFPAAANAAGPLDTLRFSFVEQTSGYEVDGRNRPGGKMLLTGTHPETGETFDLVVTPRGHVSGTFEGRQVDFNINDAKGTDTLELAAR